MSGSLRERKPEVAAAMRLDALGSQHERALGLFLEAFARAGEKRIPAFLLPTDWPHTRIVEVLSAWARGEQLPQGWVPSTTWFLFRGEAIVAVANLRHRLCPALVRCGGHVGYSVVPGERGRGLATFLLEAVKRHARAMGHARLLLTCDEQNHASSRVIEKCGGALVPASAGEQGAPEILRYWIELAPSAAS